jgi:hypothetical protein
MAGMKGRLTRTGGFSSHLGSLKARMEGRQVNLYTQYTHLNIVLVQRILDDVLSMHSLKHVDQGEED